MENIDVLITLILRGLGQMQAFATLISKARSEGRDVTRAELDGLFASDDAAREHLQELIKERT